MYVLVAIDAMHLLLHNFLKYIAIEFKSAFIFLDMSLQGPTFVA